MPLTINKSLLSKIISWRRTYDNIKIKEINNDCLKSNFKYMYLIKNPSKIASNLNKVPVLKKYESK